MDKHNLLYKRIQVFTVELHSWDAQRKVLHLPPSSWVVKWGGAMATEKIREGAPGGEGDIR